jgi:TatD DNase family protein
VFLVKFAHTSTSCGRYGTFGYQHCGRYVPCLIRRAAFDGSPELRPYWDEQVAVFEHILARCQHVGGRVLSIHSRRAASAVLDRIERFPATGTPILHWFSGTGAELERAISLGCWFSVDPAMLASAKGRSLTTKMPHNRVLTESDGPFACIKGASIMPWQAGQATETLAKIWVLQETQTSDLLNSNLRALGTNDQQSSESSQRSNRHVPRMIL